MSEVVSQQCKEINCSAIARIEEMVTGKKVLYIATTYLDYLRIQQELSIINQYADKVYVIVSSKKSYFLRLIYVYFKALFFFKKTDVVFFGFAPQLVLPFLKWRFLRNKIITDFFISLFDTLVMDRKKFRPTSFFSKILTYFDKQTLKWSDLIISDTKAHADYFNKGIGCQQSKLVTLYLQADSKYYYPKTIAKPTELKDKFLVLYFGSVLPLQGTDIIIDTINLCKNNNIYFLMIGPFDKTKCENKNVRFVDWVSQEELSDLIATADLCLAGHFNADINKASRTIPGKAYIYESMNKKMILGENLANRERYPGCYKNINFVKMGDAAALLEVIENCYMEFLNGK